MSEENKVYCDGVLIGWIEQTDSLNGMNKAWTAKGKRVTSTAGCMDVNRRYKHLQAIAYLNGMLVRVSLGVYRAPSK